MDPGFPRRYHQIAVAERERGREDEYRADGQGTVEGRGVQGVFSGVWACDGEGGAGECGDFFGGGDGECGDEEGVGGVNNKACEVETRLGRVAVVELGRRGLRAKVDVFPW